MVYTYCDKLKELTNDQVKFEKELNIPELDKMIHEIFPKVPFEMHYKVEEDVDCYRAKRINFTTESFQDLTEFSGIFSKALKECKLSTFNSNLRWDDEKGFTASLNLVLSYAHFEGGTNCMDVATFFFENGHWIKRYFKVEEE